MILKCLGARGWGGWGEPLPDETAGVEEPKQETLAHEQGLSWSAHLVCTPQITQRRSSGEVAAAGARYGALPFVSDSYSDCQRSKPLPESARSWKKIELLRAYFHRNRPRPTGGSNSRRGSDFAAPFLPPPHS